MPRNHLAIVAEALVKPRHYSQNYIKSRFDSSKINKNEKGNSYLLEFSLKSKLANKGFKNKQHK